MIKRSCIVLFLLASCSNLFAGGFQVSLQGSKQNMMSDAGSALSLDASSIFFNPGALAFMKDRFSVNAGVSLVFPNVGYQDTQGFYTAGNTNKFSNPIFFYASYRLKPESKWTISFGVNNPFGSTLIYDDNWAGQFVIREISLKTFCWQPTVTYKISEKLAIGASFNYYSGELILRKGIPVSDSTGTFGEAKLEGKAGGIGFNVGLVYKPTDKLSIALDYRSQSTLKLKNGTAEFTVPSALADSFPKTKFTSQLKLPQVVTLGLAYAFTEKFTLALDVNYTGWQCYDTLKFDYAFNSESLEDTKITKNYKGAFAFRLGGQYKFGEVITARAGAFFDMTPVQNGFLTPDGPDANRVGGSVGLSLQPMKRFGIDLSFMYLETIKRTGGSYESGFWGTYKTKAAIPTLGLQYSF